MRIGVDYIHVLDSVHPQGKIIPRIVVRLHKGHVDVEVGSHLLSYLELQGSVTLSSGFHPLPADHSAGVLE